MCKKCSCEGENLGGLKSITFSPYDALNDKGSTRSFMAEFTEKDSIDSYNKFIASAVRIELIDLNTGKVIHTF